MKNYAVLEDMKRHQKKVLDDAFNKGYDQGYHDGKLENIEKLEKSLDAEKESEYQRGYEQGRRSTITIKDFEEYYRKGFKHGQELRAKEAECAEACGMKRAWDAAKKIVLSAGNGGYSADTVMKLFGMTYHDVLVSASPLRVIEKIEAWEKQEQDAPEMNVGSIENRDKIVKAIAGLWTAYGDQLWDVVADMQKNP